MTINPKAVLWILGAAVVAAVGQFVDLKKEEEFDDLKERVAELERTYENS